MILSMIEMHYSNGMYVLNMTVLVNDYAFFYAQ